MESLVLTVIGPDKPGVVDALSNIIASKGASWEEGRMARLAGQFAGILLVKVPPDEKEALIAALHALGTSSLEVVVAHGAPEDERAGRTAVLSLVGGDRPGIVQRISRALAERGVNVDLLETEVARAPMSSELLFHASATLSIPSDVDVAAVRRDLEAIASDLMVDLALEEAD
ncbi:MAG: ACT domain-containing protein [Polyangiaceae bacterium]|nr:ACT domain-containing protein [Polyangiaceae bacterium]